MDRECIWIDKKCTCGKNETYQSETEFSWCLFDSGKHYADKHGIKIYNATRGGKLEIFDRVDFDTIF